MAAPEYHQLVHTNAVAPEQSRRIPVLKIPRLHALTRYLSVLLLFFTASIAHTQESDDDEIERDARTVMIAAHPTAHEPLITLVNGQGAGSWEHPFDLWPINTIESRPDIIPLSLSRAREIELPPQTITQMTIQSRINGFRIRALPATGQTPVLETTRTDELLQLVLDPINSERLPENITGTDLAVDDEGATYVERGQWRWYLIELASDLPYGFIREDGLDFDTRERVETMVVPIETRTSAEETAISAVDTIENAPTEAQTLAGLSERLREDGVVLQTQTDTTHLWETVAFQTRFPDAEVRANRILTHPEVVQRFKDALLAELVAKHTDQVPTYEQVAADPAHYLALTTTDGQTIGDLPLDVQTAIEVNGASTRADAMPFAVFYHEPLTVLRTAQPFPQVANWRYHQLTPMVAVVATADGLPIVLIHRDDYYAGKRYEPDRQFAAGMNTAQYAEVVTIFNCLGTRLGLRTDGELARYVIEPVYDFSGTE